MEAEREREWKATEAEGYEEETAAEELGGGLIRKRSKGKMGNEVEEKAANRGEGTSVFFDEDKGVWKCRHCTWTYYLMGPGIYVIRKHEGNCQVLMDVETLIQIGTHADSPIKGAYVVNGSNGLKLGETNVFVAEENLGNGITNVGATKLNNVHHNLKNGVIGNGLNSQLSFEKWSGNGSMRSENEIKEYDQREPESNMFLAEYDLERVLEEQETHDLFCPKCNSCITKRVILRKRKRPQKENLSDYPPYKVPHVPETIPAPHEPIEYEDKTAFRCLSCFSIFIPTECGCNIFRIFWEGDGSNTAGKLEGKPAKNWVSSLFGSRSRNLQGSSAGGLGSNGGIVGNQAQAHVQINPIPIVPEGNNINKPVTAVRPTSPRSTDERNQNVRGPDTPADTRINMGVHGHEGSRSGDGWDVLKSIVYGGLIESITSLGVVSSAAGSGSTTLKMCALGISNLIGGFFVISHDISELRSARDAESANQMEERTGRYWDKLGKREHFRRHLFFAILSYIVFGLLPPVIYGFTFRESDNKEYKIIAAAASSLLCVALLAIGKAHVRPQRDYIKSVFYYLVLALPATCISYVAGIMFKRLFVELGLFDATSASPSPPSSVDLVRFGSGGSSWASL